MGNWKKTQASALSAVLLIALAAVIGWIVYSFFTGGSRKGIVVSVRGGAVHAWARRIPPIVLPGEKPLTRLPDLIRIDVVADGKIAAPPLIRLPAPPPPALALISTGLSPSAPGPGKISPIASAAKKLPAPPLISIAPGPSPVPALISIASIADAPAKPAHRLAAGRLPAPPLISITPGPPPAPASISIASIADAPAKSAGHVPPVEIATPGSAAMTPISLASLESHSLSPASLNSLVSADRSRIESLRYDDDILTADEHLRRYAMSMCVDHQNNLWVGCIDSGIWRFDPTAPAGTAWTQFTTKDGLGDDNCYALACDRKGRVWAGHLNHGVSVFNGQKWQNYDVIGGLLRPDSFSGPIGERIFHIAVNPIDGDVWICTSAGLARYSESKDTWTYYTRADGLPSDQPNSIAFSSSGKIFVAMQRDGIAIGTPTASGGSGTVGGADPGRLHWRQILGPETLPTTPAGPGLPTNLLNDILVTKDGTVYCATDVGLAWSTDDGDTWQYVRGKDWSDKVKQSAAGPPAGWTDAVPPGVNLVEQDYITCLAEAHDGHLILGYQQAGRPTVPWTQTPVMKTISIPVAGGADPGRIGRTKSGVSAAGYKPRQITEIFHATSLAVAPTQLYVGTYDKEILHCDWPPARNSSPAADLPLVPARSGGGSLPPFPSGAPTPTLADLNAELTAMAAVPPNPAGTTGSPTVIALDEDWLTDGRWLGRYGRWTAILCAMLSPFDYVWGPGPEPMDYHAQIGPHNQNNDSLRYWISANQTTDPETLELPPVYMDSRVYWHLATPDQDRRPAVWDDHGEAYPGTFEGPDIYCTVRIPAGTFILTLNEQDGGSDRDLDIVIRSHHDAPLYDISGFDNEPTLAVGRATKFDGNLYKRFLVCGPAELTMKVARNYSFLSTVAAIFLDPPGERPVPYFMSVGQWSQSKQRSARRLSGELAAWKIDPARRRADFAPCTTELAAAEKLLAKMDEMIDWNPRWWALNRQRVAVLLARWAAANVGPNAPADAIAAKGSALYLAHDYEQWETCEAAIGERTSRQIEKSLRWDHVIRRDTGNELQTLSRYLPPTSAATHPAKE